MICSYVGRRDKKGIANVWVIGPDGDSRALPLRHDLANHSIMFEWGYLGSGPAQLALALLADATGDDEIAKQMHQLFKFGIVARLPRHEKWRLTQEQIAQLLKTIIETRQP